jgi:hypothetical protein
VSSVYDLLLQPQAGAPFELERVEPSLADLPRRPDGAWLVTLSLAQVELSVLREAGQAVAMQLRVPLADRTDVLDAGIAWAVALAASLQLRVLDPQANTVVNGPSATTTEEFLRQARYAGEFLGVSAALGATTLVNTPPTVSSTARVLGALVVFVIALYASFAFFTRPRPAAPPPPGPPHRVRD